MRRQDLCPVRAVTGAAKALALQRDVPILELFFTSGRKPILLPTDTKVQ
jgi:hypothetical protein